MKKKIYINPTTSIQPLLYSEPILAAQSNTETEIDWNDGTTTIKVKQEEGDNLGGADSEISGAKGHNAWSGWD